MADKILVVDDNPGLRDALELNLEQEGYQVITAGDGQEAIRLVYSEHPDLLVLDIMMPRMNGWQVCQRIREMSNMPIIMLTAKAEEADIIKGLKLGADDYLTKPFGVDELLARVHAALRRARSRGSVSEKATCSNGYLSINLDTRRVTVNGQVVKLTPTEYRLLALLAANQGQTLEFRHILESVWGAEYVGAVDYVRTYIWYLRRKIEPDPKNPCYLLTELNVGYRFELV
jgi:two-component system KDP operon response regulator KdpE